MEAFEPLLNFVDQNGVVTIVLLTAVLLLIRSIVVSIPKMFMKQNDRQQILQVAKVGESLWFFIYYLCVFTAGITYLWDKEWLQDPSKYWLPNALDIPEFPVGLQLIYTIQTAYYIGASIVTLFLSHARKNHKDKLIMLTHHFVTVTLLAVSYCFGQHRIGSVVLILHDVSDIFLEGAKLCRYAGLEGITNYTFALFALVFFISRLIILPVRVLWPIFYHYPAGHYYTISQCNSLGACSTPPFLSISIPGFWLALLGTLQCLHIYWFYLIYRMILIALRGSVETDIRSDEETDLAEAETPSPKQKRKQKAD